MIMKINIRTMQGNVNKSATIFSNDLHNPELNIRMEGTVLAVIEVKPSTSILFRGMADQLSESVVDLAGSRMPFHITGAVSNLDQDINYTLETVVEGKHYRLRVANKIRQGNYGGFIKLNTDLAQKPDIMIRVSGFVEGEISARPQNILIGKLIAGQPERVARVVVVSNRNKPFEITRMIYDEDLMSVEISKEALQNQMGYILDVKPRLEAVPAGKRRQAPLEIQTNLSPDEKVQVTVNVLNNSDQPETLRRK